MTNKTTKSALLTSSIALLLCFAMLIGTTFAWFTDSATSANNIIKAGNLDVEMYYADGTKVVPALDSTDWNDASQGAIFNYDLWEPGYVDVKHIKIANEGSLALKYQIAIVANGEVSKLSDVIDVYFVDPATQVANRTALVDTYKIGTLTEVLAAMPGSTYGDLASGNANIITLALKMQESAGNEYKNLSIGTDFKVVLTATQLNAEPDSFDADYDKDAELPDIVVDNAADLQDAIDNAINNAQENTVISLAGDVTGNLEIPQTPGVEVVIDGNGNTIEGGVTVDGGSGTYTTAGVVIQNVDFKVESKADLNGADACIRLGDGTNNTRYTCNVTIRNCTFDLGGDLVGIKSYTGGDKNLTISNCTATARTHSLAQLKGVDGVLVENCTVKSVRGINFNNSINVNIVNSTIDVQKYAVRFGSDNNNTEEVYAISNSTLSSKNVEGDPVIEFRAGAMTGATLTLTNTTINGNIQMTGHENVNIVKN